MVKVESRLVMKMHAMCCCPSMAATASHCQALPRQIILRLFRNSRSQVTRLPGDSNV
ncbi:hypothetical protein I7I51_04062 [Histoplasma capsulatum]|uniref:Uncharacterized protein n=1 Tax=Ajellomyces capsulatus TaxID=5037 RepID=A0A8A1M832_AJECA|nr:hypothetical protein I7I51_04062 [Histoplasma capsulatum]